MQTSRLDPREVHLELTTDELLLLGDSGCLTFVTPNRLVVTLSVRDAVCVDVSGELIRC